MLALLLLNCQSVQSSTLKICQVLKRIFLRLVSSFSLWVLFSKSDRIKLFPCQEKLFITSWLPKHASWKNVHKVLDITTCILTITFDQIEHCRYDSTYSSFFVDHHKCHQYFPDSSRHHGEKHSASELLQRFLKDQLHLWFNKDDKAFKPLKISHGSIKPHFLAQKSQKVVQAQLFFPKYLLLSK